MTISTKSLQTIAVILSAVLLVSLSAVPSFAQTFDGTDDNDTLLIDEGFQGGNIIADDDAETLFNTVARPFVTGMLWVYETFGTYIVIGGFIVLLVMYGRRWFSMRSRQRI